MQHASESSAVGGSSSESGRRAVRVSGMVPATPAQVWEAFTTSHGAETFFAQRAKIQLALGGPYEIFFDPEDDQQGTKGLKILSYAPEEMISMEWNAPPRFPVIREGGTWVVVQMHAVADGQTQVTLSHLGWKAGEEWDRAYPHFVQGWNELMSRLQHRFTIGPIDWKTQTMMYQARKSE